LIHEPRRSGVGRQEPEIKPPADGSVADPAS
jgi:hypothetical protein